MHADKLFERFARAPANEVRIRGFLDTKFPNRPDGTRSYDVECHGTVCKLTALAGAPEQAIWQRDIQNREDAIGLVAGILFSYGDVFIKLEAFDARDAVVYLARVSDAADAAALWTCDSHDVRGEVTFDLVFDSGTRTVTTGEAGGSLATSDVSACLRGVVDDVLRRMPVPATMLGLPAQHRMGFAVPLKP